jgi:cell division protein FtsB
MKYGNRTFWHKVSSSPVVMVIVIILLIVIIRANFRIYGKVYVSNQRLQQSENEIARLQERKLELTSKVDKLSTGEGVESEIRSKYMAVKEGESIAVIIDDSEKNNYKDNMISTTTDSWYKKVWKWMIGLK